MPDFLAVLSSVEDRLAVVARRREELERQCADVAREHDRLAATVSVMKEHAGLVGQPSAAESSPDPPVTDRVLDAIVGSSADSRASLLQLFRPLGVNENSIDSAIKRLKKRGIIQQRGKALVPVESPSSASVAQPSPESAPSDVGQGPAVRVAAPLEAEGHATSPGAVMDPAGDSGDAAAASRASSADRSSKRAQVLDAVVALDSATRPAIVAHLAPRGITGANVDSALKGLRRVGKLKRRAGGVYVVVGGFDAPSPSSDDANDS